MRWAYGSCNGWGVKAGVMEIADVVAVTKDDAPVPGARGRRHSL